jgi:hypothetical protein
MKAGDFEKKFEAAKDITKYLDLAKARHAGQEYKRVNVDFPEWMVQSLDKAAHTG